MSRTVVVNDLSAADLKLVKEACKALGRPERLAVRDLLVEGAVAALALKPEKVTLDAPVVETLED